MGGWKMSMRVEIGGFVQVVWSTRSYLNQTPSRCSKSPSADRRTAPVAWAVAAIQRSFLPIVMAGFGRGSTLRSGDRLPATPRVNQSVGSQNVRIVDGKRGQFLEYPVQLDSLPSAPTEFLSKGTKFAHAHYGRKPNDGGISKAKLLVCPTRPWCLPSEPKQQVRVEQESLHLARWSVECSQQFFDWLITRPSTP